MIAQVGDKIHVHSSAVDRPDRVGEILEVHGSDGAPPYLVEFSGGRQTIVYPGPDATIESPSAG